MLREDLHYVCFDFETTGLDTKKDEAIQIGIVKFNHKFQITDQFSSYIKPYNFDNIKNLSEIVEFTTGINLEQLKNKPLFSEIAPQIKGFFDKNSLLIGHNIDFDINFLKKYLGKIDYFDKFDTYAYSRLLLHFEPSYSLEILADKYDFKSISHDALQDSIMTMELFKFLIKKVEKLLKKYPFLADILIKGNSIFSKILKIKKTNKTLFSIPKKPINLQKPKKIKTNNKIISSYENKTVFNVENLSFEESLNFALNGQNKVILAFSSESRCSRAKNLLKQKYITASPLNTGYTLSNENEKKLLQKQKLEDFEANYILKAFSHYHDELSIFDITSFNEIKVYNFLADKKRNFTSNIIITTHLELFKYIGESNKNIKDFTIVFFDWHYWMNSLGKAINQGFDFYYFIDQLELLKYKIAFSKDISEIEKLINQVSTFFGILGIKIKPLFKGTNNKIEAVNLLEEVQFGINQIRQPFENLDKILNKFFNNYKQFEEIKNIQKNWEIFKECITNYCFIEQKITLGGQLKYIFWPLRENIDINVFNDLMEGLTYYCFTLLDSEKYIKLGDKKNKTKLIDYENKDFKVIVENVKKEILQGKSIYLISNNKKLSHELFKVVFKLFKEHNLKGNIYVENITGGQGKLIYYLQKDYGPKVTIGGPEFLIQNKAKNIDYTNYYIISLQGKNRELLIKDLEFYLD